MNEIKAARFGRIFVGIFEMCFIEKQRQQLSKTNNSLEVFNKICTNWFERGKLIPCYAAKTGWENASHTQRSIPGKAWLIASTSHTPQQLCQRLWVLILKARRKFKGSSRPNERRTTSSVRSNARDDLGKRGQQHLSSPSWNFIHPSAHRQANEHNQLDVRKSRQEAFSNSNFSLYSRSRKNGMWKVFAPMT